MGWLSAWCLIFHIATQEIPTSRFFLPAWRNNDHTVSAEKVTSFISSQPPLWRMMKQPSHWLPSGITNPLSRQKTTAEQNTNPTSSTIKTVCRETVEAKWMIINDEELQNSHGTERDTKTCPGQIVLSSKQLFSRGHDSVKPTIICSIFEEEGVFSSPKFLPLWAFPGIRKKASCLQGTAKELHRRQLLTASCVY